MIQSFSLPYKDKATHIYKNKNKMGYLVSFHLVPTWYNKENLEQFKWMLDFTLVYAFEKTLY